MPWSINALEAGKHVLCEKPLTRRAADAEAAFDAAERAGRLLMEAFMWRYHPQTEALVRLAEEIAPLRVVRAAFGFRLPDEDTANVRLQADLDGGALMDVGCYCVSALRLLCGEPDRVSAELVGRAGVDGRFAGVLRFPGDVLGMFDCGFDVPPRGVDRGRRRGRHAGRRGPLARRWRRGSRATARRSRSRLPTRTGSSSRTSRRRSAPAASRGSGARTRSARRARSRCCTRRPSRR